MITDIYVKSEKIEKVIKDNSFSVEERGENWETIDEIINYKFVDSVLSRLPEEDHKGFIDIYVESPNDEAKVFGFLKEKAGPDIEKELKEDLKRISSEMIEGLVPQDEVKVETQSEGKPPVK